ncbi:MAG: anti-sigma factor antagonist [Proteobacteria bacterium]|nr:anti-sigma factor antagonist [Pseudomonadota bacterium]NDC23641.1 anti-sigma factor antagonist [Pseudomonadota bacterium]NDD04226.1 anti-sigma factor antagonist [Pseudomonadota bacterium]NDG25906.1 anti-sigma factor antagonist [Pseudomonadota bacterium]
MIIRARQQENVVIFNLEGHLDFETIVKFEETCQKIYSESTQQRVIVNMEQLRFVGSSGINQFVQVLKDINHREVKPKLVNVSSEFEKIFRALQTTRHPFHIFENETQGILAFDGQSETTPVVTKKSKKKCNA